jgi:hypothetical protein
MHLHQRLVKGDDRLASSPEPVLSAPTPNLPTLGPPRQRPYQSPRIDKGDDAAAARDQRRPDIALTPQCCHLTPPKALRSNRLVSSPYEPVPLSPPRYQRPTPNLPTSRALVANVLTNLRCTCIKDWQRG